MKKTVLLLAVLLLVSGGIRTSSAQNRRGKAPAERETVAENPLEGERYRSDKSFWRAVQGASAADFATAQENAERMCREDLGATVQAVTESAVASYCRQFKGGERQTLASAYGQLARTVVRRQLADITQVAQKASRQEDGSICFHICLQASKTKVEEQLVAEFARQAERLRFDSERFRAVFAEELARFAEQEQKQLAKGRR